MNQWTTRKSELETLLNGIDREELEIHAENVRLAFSDLTTDESVQILKKLLSSPLFASCELLSELIDIDQNLKKNWQVICPRIGKTIHMNVEGSGYNGTIYTRA